MVRYFFGHGPWVVWYILMYAALLVGVFLPTLGFLPLKKPGEKPDPASLGSVFFVMFMAFVLAMITLVNTAVFSRVLSANLVYKGLLILAAAAAVAVGAYFAAAMLATEQSRRSLALWALCALALVAANLWLAHIGISRPPGSIHAPGQMLVWVLLAVAAIPVAYYTFMVLVGFVLIAMEKLRR